MAHLTDKRLIEGYEYNAPKAGLCFILDANPRDISGFVTGWDLIADKEVNLPAMALCTLLDSGAASIDPPIAWERGLFGLDDVPRGIIK